MILSGTGGEQFRGFLVQARTVADGSPVGVFIDNGDDQTLSSCLPPEVRHSHIVASVPGLPCYVRVLICGGGDNAVKTGKAWAD